MNKRAKIANFVKQVEVVRRYYKARRLFIYPRAYRLLRSEFSPKEIFLWGLLDPAIDNQSLSKFVSKESFLKFQSLISPVSHACLLEDKEVFYRYCEAIDFPIPETIAFLSQTAEWFPFGRLASAELSLQARLDSLHGAELIIKPCDGVYGLGIRALSVESGSFMEDGRRFSLSELKQELAPGSRYILQRRLVNHPVIGDLTGLKTLQALRVVTALPKAPGERGRVMSASLRLSANESVVNNFDYGRGGNVRAKIDIESGCITLALRASASGFGLEAVDVIPLTDRNIIGFELPFWPEMKELLEVKAACFYPIRLVGWDVALTATGPVVIEGNFWFDPTDNSYGDVTAFMHRIATEDGAQEIKSNQLSTPRGT